MMITWRIVSSHVESWLNRLNYASRPLPQRLKRPERRHNPRTCALCHGPMRPDKSRPPRDERRPDGTMRRLPEETLAWFRCARCHGSQVGVRP